MGQLTGALRKQRKRRVHKRVNNKSDNVIRNVNQELMPPFGFICLENQPGPVILPDEVTYRMHQGNDTNNQFAAQQPTGSSQGDLKSQHAAAMQGRQCACAHPSGNIGPASDPRKNRHPPLPGDYLR